MPDEAAPAEALSEEDRSKDAFFVALGKLVEGMRAEHGKDFAVGTLLLAARFIVDGKQFSKGGSG